GHRQHLGRLAADLLAVDPDLVGVRIDADVRRGVVALQVLLADRAAVFDGDDLALQAVLRGNPAVQRYLRDKRQAGLRQRPAERGELRPGVDRLRRRNAG